MEPIIAAAIQKAYDFIQVGKLEDAQAVLVPMVKTHPNSPEIWYVLGFALTDTDKRLYAFQQVTRIDPTNQPAQKQIAKLLAPKSPAPPPPPSPSTSPFTVMPDLTDAPVSPFKVMPDFKTMPPATQPAVEKPYLVKPPVPYPVATNEPGPVTEKEQPQKKRISPVLIGVAVLIVLVVVAGIVLFSNKGLAAQVLPFFFANPTSAQSRATSTFGPTPLPTARIPVFRPAACPFTLPLGTRVRCGTVRVPQDRQNNSTRSIDLSVVAYQSSKPAADAVLFLQDGPGVESINWSLALFQDYVAPILADHDVVFFDSRGTGRSKPALSCPELNPVFIDAYYQNRLQDEAFADFLNLWGKCHERFVAEGVDPAAFNTTESAADVNDIVTALGYKQVNLLGISYGTRLGLAIMRDYPTIVRSAVLDSVVPMERKMFNRRGSDTQDALNKLFVSCAGNTRCNAAYPDLAKIFNALVEQFTQTPTTIKVNDPSTGFASDIKANGVDLISAVVTGMQDSELVPVVPKAIYDIQKGDYTFLSYALGVRGGTYNETELATYFSTICPDQVYSSNTQELDLDLNITPVIKEYSLAGLFGSAQNLFALCDAWGAKISDPQNNLPVKVNTPTLIISGQYDPITPDTTGKMVADNLPNSHFYVIPGMGHDATIGNACSSAMMVAFLKEPGKAPDATCLSKPSEFFLPYNGERPVELVDMSDATNGLQGLAPAGWKKKLPNAPYFRHAYLFDTTQVQITAFNYTRSTVLDDLTKNFEKSGFEGAPKKLDNRTVNGLSWTIYTTKFNGDPVIMALAQVDTTRTLGLIMVVSAPERDAFYNGLFMPILDALVPMW